jgi:hypothetical protein
MKYEEFRHMVLKLPVIDNNILKLKDIFSHSNRIQFSRWLKKGYILKLKKGGLYILREADRKINPSRMFIGCELYKPSYISMEYALSHYGLIPERVYDITCITTKKTNSFENTFGRFVYQHVKPEFFTGFVESKDEFNLAYFIAKPEKAVIDYIYLNLSKFKADAEKQLVESFRFQNLESLNIKLLKEYSRLFKIKKLDKIVEKLIKLSGEVK